VTWTVDSWWQAWWCSE